MKNISNVDAPIIDSSVVCDFVERNDADECAIVDEEGRVSFEKRYRIQHEEAVSLRDVYILQIDACFADGSTRLVAGLSDYRCVVYDVEAQMRSIFARDAHQDVITDVKVFAEDAQCVYTGSLDGAVKLWDTRVKAQPALQFKDESDGGSRPKPISSFDVSCDRRLVCGGTPLVEADAYLLFWDARKSSSALGGYWETHTDDVTQVRFSGRRPNLMLSGGADGLVGVFDVSRSCEDEALSSCANVDVVVRKLRWLDDDRTFGCVTDMETVQVWRVDDAGQPMQHFDRRSLAEVTAVRSWDDAYVCDIYTSASKDALILSGSNAGKGDYFKALRFSEDATLQPYASFEENKQLVRCSCYDAQRDRFVTAGECGIISVWEAREPGAEKTCLKKRVQKKKNRKSK